MNPDKPLNYRIIDTASKLKTTAAQLEKEKAIAFDLEADSMFHFVEKVCLIQVATRQKNYLIDALKINNLSFLKPIFANPDIVKIFHGADYDVRCLYRDYNIRINNLFDTQIACRFLGLSETGLDAVVLKLFDIQLDKKYQKKDWSVRPLPQDMLAYAARDVVYLLPVFKIFETALKQKGRLSWVKEECRLLSRVKPVSPNNEPLFLKFKGAGRMKPRELALLETILKLRIELARKKDRPPFKIFSNASILKLVKLSPRNIHQLKKAKILSEKQLDMYGKELISAIRRALDLPAAELTAYPRKQAPKTENVVRKRIKQLKLWRDMKAREMGLDPALLCSKTALADVARHNPTSVGQINQITELKNWQKKALGHEMITVLRNKHGRSI